MNAPFFRAVCSIGLFVIATNAWAQDAPAPAGESRIWTDNTGAHKIEAAFVSLADGKITLKKADGTLLTLPLFKLSEADRKVARTLAAGGKLPMPVEPKPRPMPGGPAIGPIAIVPSTGSRTLDPPPTMAAPIALTSAGPVQALPALNVPWQAKPDGSASTVTPPAKPIDLVVPPKGQLEFGPAGLENQLQFARSAPEAWLCRLTWNTEKGQLPAYVERIDLKGQRSLGLYSLPADAVLAAVSPTGRFIATRLYKTEGAEPDRVDVFEVAGAKLKHLVSFNMFADLPQKKENAAHTTQAWFLDDSRLLVFGGGHLRLVDLSAKSYVYTISGVAMSAELSPGGKLLATYSNGRIVLLDSATGALQGVAEGEIKQYVANLGFSPDGTRLGTMQDGTIYYWDIATGKKLGMVETGLSADFSWPIRWISSRYVLADRNLCDLELKAAVWRYFHPVSTAATHNGVLWYGCIGELADGRAGLGGLVLPHPAALRALQGLTATSVGAARTKMHSDGSKTVGMTGLTYEGLIGEDLEPER